MAVWLLIGAALAAVCVAAPLRWAAAAMVFTLPMSGTAAMMLGPDPLLLPMVCALGFLGRIAFSLLIPEMRAQFVHIVRTDWLMLAFVAYCALSGLFNPRFFANATYVNPQNPGPLQPLGPWSVEIPQVIYLIIGAAIYMGLRWAILRVGLKSILYALIWQAIGFGAIGLTQAIGGVAGFTIPLDWIVNNEGGAIMSLVYVQGGFVRVSSVFLESSACAAWAAGATGFIYGVYINRILPQLTFPLLCGLGFMMLVSTSSTAYAGLAAIGALALVYAVLDPERGRRERGIILIAAFGLVAAMALLVIFAADNSGVLGRFREMVLDFTVNKAQSDSAIERGSWARQSVQNAIDTSFMGVGYGAARSSGLFYQLVGTIGAPGLALFALAFGPIALRAFQRVRTGEDAVAAAGAFGMITAFLTLSISGTEMSMSNLFWVLAAVGNAPLKERQAMLQRQAHEQSSAQEAGANAGAAPAPA
jgi:hypothetical protein